MKFKNVNPFNTRNEIIIYLSAGMLIYCIMTAFSNLYYGIGLAFCLLMPFIFRICGDYFFYYVDYKNNLILILTYPIFIIGAPPALLLESYKDLAIKYLKEDPKYKIKMDHKRWAFNEKDREDNEGPWPMSDDIDYSE